MDDMKAVEAALRPIEPDVKALRAMGADAVQPLAAIASGSDPQLAMRAVFALGAVAETLAPEDSDAFHAIAAVLGKAAVHKDDVMRVAAAHAAHALPPELAAGVQAPLLADPDAGVRKTALEMSPRALTGDHVAAIERLLQQETEKAVAQLAQEVLENHPRV